MISLHSDFAAYPRLGNQLFIRAYATFLRKRWGCDLYPIPDIGITESQTVSAPLVATSSVGDITDDNAEEFVSRPLRSARLCGFFQNPSLLHREDYAAHLRGAYSVRARETSANSVFVHVRAGDIGNDSRMLPYAYYAAALERTQHVGGVVSTDSPDHPVVTRLCSEYGLSTYVSTPAEALIEGAAHAHVVTGLGSFSFWIGMLCNGDLHSITAEQAETAYGTPRWHPNYDIRKIKLTTTC